MKLNNIMRALFLLIYMMSPLLTHADSPADDLFIKGNNYYAKGAYKEALHTYKKIIITGNQSGAIYFNMGNASYKLGDIPSAVLYYEKAHRILPGDDDINFNLAFANSKTGDKIEEVPEFFISTWWKSVYLSYSASTFAAISIVLVLLGSAFLILYFFAYSSIIKRYAFYTAIVFFFLGLFTVFITSRQVNYFEDHKEAIVFSSPVTVKSAPADQSRSLFIIHEGTKVNILDSNNGWMKIKLGNGNVGWMKSSDLKEI